MPPPTSGTSSPPSAARYALQIFSLILNCFELIPRTWPSGTASGQEAVNSRQEALEALCDKYSKGHHQQRVEIVENYQGCLGGAEEFKRQLLEDIQRRFVETVDIRGNSR